MWIRSKDQRKLLKAESVELREFPADGTWGVFVNGTQMGSYNHQNAVRELENIVGLIYSGKEIYEMQSDED